MEVKQTGWYWVIFKDSIDQEPGCIDIKQAHYGEYWVDLHDGHRQSVCAYHILYFVPDMVEVYTELLT